MKIITALARTCFRKLRKLARQLVGFASRIWQKLLVIFLGLSLGWLGFQYLQEAEFVIGQDIGNYNKTVAFHEDGKDFENWFLEMNRYLGYSEKAFLSTQDPRIKSRISYNIGTMLAGGKIFLPGDSSINLAIAYLGEALRYNPDDIDASYNLEVALLKRKLQPALGEGDEFGPAPTGPGKGERGKEY